MTTNAIKYRKFMATTVIVSLLIVVSTFQACGPGKLDDGNSNSFAVGPGGEMISADATKTISVTDSENSLVSLVSMLGIRQPSSRTLNAYNREKTKIADSGRADSVNAPMWNAISNLAGETCWDLIQQEKALAADQRRIFAQVDFNKPPNALTNAAKDDSIRRLARSVLSRNETEQEKSIVKAGLSEAFGTSTTVADTARAMLYACTAVASSINAHAR